VSHALFIPSSHRLTGRLAGKDVVNVFLTSYRPFFSRVIAVVRDPSSPAAKALAEQGAEIRHVNPADPLLSFTQAFEGVDAVINVVGKSPLEYKDTLFQAALKSGVKVYFPSEYGVDHRLHSFPGWDDVEWNLKREHAQKSHELAGNKIKIVSVYTGLFLEGALGPWFGFDTANLTYTAVGSPDEKFAVTSKADIGRALAELSLLAFSPETASSVPNDVRIAGENVSYRQVRDIVQGVRNELGVEPKGEIVLKSEPLEPFKALVKEEQLKSPAPGPLRHIKILVAEGKLDFSAGNHDELVNPGQKVWKWKTVEEYVREVGGKPFS